MEVVAGGIGFIAFIVIVVPLLFKLKGKYMAKAIAKYNEANGTAIKIEKTGIPPIKFWLMNRKGDCWSLVSFPDGSRKWARLRGGFFSGKDPLTFYDAK